MQRPALDRAMDSAASQGKSGTWSWLRGARMTNSQLIGHLSCHCTAVGSGRYYASMLGSSSCTYFACVCRIRTNGLRSPLPSQSLVSIKISTISSHRHRYRIIAVLSHRIAFRGHVRNPCNFHFTRPRHSRGEGTCHIPVACACGFGQGSNTSQVSDCTSMAVTELDRRAATSP